MNGHFLIAQIATVGVRARLWEWRRRRDFFLDGTRTVREARVRSWQMRRWRVVPENMAAARLELARVIRAAGEYRSAHGAARLEARDIRYARRRLASDSKSYGDRLWATDFLHEAEQLAAAGSRLAREILDAADRYPQDDL